MTRQTTFDVKQFLDDHFGGVVPLLEQHPDYWTSEQIHKWRRRESLPGPDLATLLGIIEARDNSPVSITKYIQGKPCPTTSSAKSSTIGSTSSIFD